LTLANFEAGVLVITAGRHRARSGGCRAPGRWARFGTSPSAKGILNPSRRRPRSVRSPMLHRSAYGWQIAAVSGKLRQGFASRFVRRAQARSQRFATRGQLA
jgi:hypothetical protein